MAQFSLSWDAYKQNICSGLSALQQNGEFVDMTIAADGHHVKVHQIILSLVSPYIKELISSAQCPHPIIFLNKTTYPTLCAILEYIYTGEVMVSKENLPELIEAAKELHIMGLWEMKLELSSQSTHQAGLAKQNEGEPVSDTAFFKDTAQDQKAHDKRQGVIVMRSKNRKQNDQETDADETYGSGDQGCDVMDTDHDDDHADNDMKFKIIKKKRKASFNDTRIQYTVSNQGSLQIVLNRFVYLHRYTSRRSGNRRWACVERRSNRCPATVITDDDIVVQRISKHNHPFHDHKILKKVRSNAIFHSLQDAEIVGERKRQTNTDTSLDTSVMEGV